MKCKDLMTKHVKTCTPECTAKQAAQIMQDWNCGVVPIINKNDEIQGIVTDRDIALYTALKNKKAENVYVKEFMTKNVFTCRHDQDIDTAISVMKSNKVRRLPIVNQQNQLVGLISLGDIAVLSHEEHETFEALESISSPISSQK